MHTLPRLLSCVLLAMALVAAPASVQAQGLGGQSGPWKLLGIAIVGLAVAGVLLTKVWLGVVNAAWLHLEPLSSIEKRRPYVPTPGAVAFTVFSTVALIALAAHAGATIAPFMGPGGLTRAAVFFGVAALAWIAAELRYAPLREYAFAFGIGALLTFALVGFQRALFAPGAAADPYAVALGIVCIALAWRMLFGPWAAHVKATVLGTFIVLMSAHLLWDDPPDQLKAHLLAIIIAAVPAVIWCLLFLQEHRERLSSVLLMFFAGMLSTVPILFYDLLVRSGMELQFFVFRIVPESFTRSSSAFVSSSLAAGVDLRASLLSTLVTFLIVGLIEETSKYWVVSRSARSIVSSVDDVIQLSVIVAIGFAFAENILNPTYFLAFVQQYLLTPASPQWGSFVGNVMGRSILTSMVHILSTGVLGYFLGLAIFAGPVVRDVERDGREYLVASVLGRILRIPEKTVFRVQMLLTGILLATVLHGLFNFTVTLPELLPTHPKSIGDLLGAAAGSPLHGIPFLLIPSLFYVVGGFWLLTALLTRTESCRERGILVTTDTFVRETAAG
jgi:hypothetical protein